MGTASGIVIAVWVLGIILAILWIALPFAVFGIKGRLDDIIRELRKLNAANGRD